MNDVLFMLLLKLIFDIIFFNVEEFILMKYLRIEIVLVELGYEIDVEFGKFESLECFYYVNVYLFVYVYYMKYKCCRYMERNIDLCRVL